MQIVWKLLTDTVVSQGKQISVLYGRNKLQKDCNELNPVFSLRRSDSNLRP